MKLITLILHKAASASILLPFVVCLIYIVKLKRKERSNEVYLLLSFFVFVLFINLLNSIFNAFEINNYVFYKIYIPLETMFFLFITFRWVYKGNVLPLFISAGVSVLVLFFSFAVTDNPEMPSNLFTFEFIIMWAVLMFYALVSFISDDIVFESYQFILLMGMLFYSLASMLLSVGLQFYQVDIFLCYMFLSIEALVIILGNVLFAKSFYKRSLLSGIPNNHRFDTFSFTRS